MMKLISILSACLLCADARGPSSVDPFEDEYGLGIIHIHEYPNAFFVLHMYDIPDDNAPHSRVIEMPWIDGGRIVDGWHEEWDALQPYRVFSGEGYPYLVCTAVKDKWYQVRLKDQKEYWVRQEERSFSEFGTTVVLPKLELVGWGTFMAEKAWVGRTDLTSNPIRTRPSSKADIIEYAYGDCLRPIGVRGRWLKVRPENGEGCISDTLEGGSPDGFFEHGWVQWRNDSAFMLRTTY